MSRCSQCDELAEKRTFASPDDYQHFVRGLVERLDQGRLMLERGDCPLSEILNPTWPTGDVVTHDLRCTSCGRGFHLYVNVWNGRNSWETRA